MTHTQNLRNTWPNIIRCTGFLWFIFAAMIVSAADERIPTGEFVDRIYRDDAGEHRYVVFLPTGYTDAKSWPVILWLHGASARGNDGRYPLVSGLAPNIVPRRETFPFIVVFPQCENLQSRLLGGWTDDSSDADRALRILAAVEQDVRIDPRRRVLAGVSMGAFGVWAIAARTPDRWSALTPISGGAPLTVVESLKTVPVWAFHAADDQVVPPSASSSLVDAINALGGQAYFTELPNGGHAIASRVCAKDELYAWMENPRQPPRQPADWPNDAAANPQLQDEVRFVPGAEVDRAVHVQIGTDVLSALAWSLPGQIPAESLQGSRGAQTETSGTGLMRFQVTVPGVSYSGRVTFAQIDPLPENRLRIRLGLQPLQMLIQGTEIEGRVLRAHAGPMQVVIGARRPAWLDLVLRPRVESRRLRLELVSADFPIEPDNWYVTEPDVEVRPLPMLRNRISQRITDGIYAKQGEISQQVISGVPKLLEQIEQQAEARLDRVVTFGRWPMPVWQPRAKFWMSDVTVSSGGIAVRLGATLGALARQSKENDVRRHAGPATPPPTTSTGVQIAVATDVISAWSELLASSDVRYFHTRDFQSRNFRRLGDREFLAQVLPGWSGGNSSHEFRSVLSFEQPIRLSPGEDVVEDGKTTTAMRLAGKELRLTISERTDPDAAWSPVAEFPLAWQQDIRMAIEKFGHRRRALHVSSPAPLRVKSTGRWLGRYADSPHDVNDELVAVQFRKGFTEMFAEAPERETALPEQRFGDVPFVCEDLGIQPDYVVMRLAPPVTQIRNLSRDPLAYEVQLPGGPWSETHELPPGMMHEFATPAPLTWRYRTANREFVFTLPIGSASRFRSGEEQPLTLVNENPASVLMSAGTP